jgi:hypothetical protein
VTGPRPNAWACGERFFVPGETSLKHGAGLAQSVQVHAVTDARYDALAVPLYSADSTVHGVSRRAVFTMAGGSCKLLGGDLGPVLGTGFTLDQSVAQSASSFSSLLGATGIDPLKGNADRLAYAFALVSLADPDVSGAGGSRLTLLYDAADLSRIAAASTGRCAQAAGKRRKDLEKAAGRIAIPRIDATAQGDTVTFWTWSQAGGTVYVNTVFLGRDGGVSIHRETVASHIGAHAEAPQQADAGRPARTS